MHDLALIISVFIATLVEAVEALTIVMAAGLARDWKSARQGAIAGLATVAVIIAAFGPLLTLFPVEILRLIVGLLSLIFGLQWLRKAIQRASGYKALHDEDKIFKTEMEQAKTAVKERRSIVSDWYAFTISYKAVVIEGIEVAFLVVTFGALQNKIPVAALSATVAVMIVVAAGFILHRPLSKVPENTLKFAVGLILTTFGIFWTTEGLGIEWAMQDLVLLPIITGLSVVSLLLVLALKMRKRSHPDSQAKLAQQPRLPLGIEFIYDFVVGDDWPTAVIIYLTVISAFLGFKFEYLVLSVVLVLLSWRMLAITRLRKSVSA